jgi:glutaminase
MNYEKIITEIASEVRPLYGQGKVADYIPELGKVSPEQFGLCLQMNDGASYEFGDSRTRFSIQSISKVFMLSRAFSLLGENFGLPGKSGVGGGIAALLPGQYSIAVWSPELNSKGNSVLGTRALELFTTQTGRSVF